MRSNRDIGQEILDSVQSIKQGKGIKIDHIALLISDLERARIFYGDILGLEEINRPEFRIPGIWYQLGEYQLHLMLLPNMYRPQFHPENRTVQPHLRQGNHWFDQ